MKIIAKEKQTKGKELIITIITNNNINIEELIQDKREEYRIAINDFVKSTFNFDDNNVFFEDECAWCKNIMIEGWCINPNCKMCQIKK